VIAQIYESFGYPAGATANVKDCSYTIGDMGNQEVDIVFLGDV
jgi:hypothetical protein